MNKSKNIRWEREGEVGILYLGNPPENYITDPEFVSLSQLNKWLSEEVKGLIITGTGRHFSAGADLKTLLKQAEAEPGLFQKMIDGNRLLTFIDHLEFPVVASISGVCFGGGLEIALAADIRICDERSLLAFPEVNHDLIPGLGGLKRLEKTCGHKTAMEILLSGDIFNAKRASELNLVDYVVPAKECFEFSRNYIKGLIAGRSSKVIKRMMRSFRNSDRLDQDKAMEEDVKMFCELAMDYSLRKKSF